METTTENPKKTYRKSLTTFAKIKMHQIKSKRCLEKIILSHRASPTTQYHPTNRESIPLCQVKRFSPSQLTKLYFSRQRRYFPFCPLYEIEWQKNTWLQLDVATSKQIERMRAEGHTHLVVRKDSMIQQHMLYDHPKQDTDILLELILTQSTDRQFIHCHYHDRPLQFAVRRSYLWRIEYDVGFAYLPSWIDQDLCCSHAVLDAHSAMASIIASSSLGSSIESY